MKTKNLSIIVGARTSKLAVIQVEEVVEGILYHHPHLSFALKCCQTKGDIDQKTSLRNLGQTDFFTHELDQWLLTKKCRIAIHSAKDLPDPLPKGLKVVALTQNKNNKDALVLKSGAKLKDFSKIFRVGTSSLKRQEGIQKLVPSAKIYDIRGTIENRIHKVIEGELDGVVIAKVALMRLNLMHLNVLDLEVQTSPLQGSLAILAREGDKEIESIFSSIDSRRGQKSLFLGLDPKRFLTSGEVIHYPIIQIQPRHFDALREAYYRFLDSTHLLFTSQSTVRIFFDLLRHFKKPIQYLNQKKIIAVGRRTCELLMKNGILVDYVAQNESQEGLMALFSQLKWSSGHLIFYPKSSGSRPDLIEYFKDRGIQHEALDLYDTVHRADTPKPKLEEFDEIVFTSTSAVKSFFEHFNLPEKKIHTIFKGPVTQKSFKDLVLNK